MVVKLVLLNCLFIIQVGMFFPNIKQLNTVTERGKEILSVNHSRLVMLSARTVPRITIFGAVVYMSDLRSSFALHLDRWYSIAHLMLRFLISQCKK